MSFAREELAERLRAFPWRGPVIEKRMFGAIAFMQRGNMVVAATRDGTMMARVGKDGVEAAIAVPGVARMEMNGRTMAGFVVVDGDVIEDEDALFDWVGRAKSFADTLPAKEG